LVKYQVGVIYIFSLFSSGKLYGLVVPIYKQNKNLFRRAHWYLAKTQIKKYQLPFFCSIDTNAISFKVQVFFSSQQPIHKQALQIGFREVSNVMGL
jgi:hypothetical protein